MTTPPPALLAAVLARLRPAFDVDGVHAALVAARASGVPGATTTAGTAAGADDVLAALVAAGLAVLHPPSGRYLRAAPAAASVGVHAARDGTRGQPGGAVAPLPTRARATPDVPDVLAPGAVLDAAAFARALAGALAVRSITQAEAARRLGVLPAVVSMALRPWDHPERGRTTRDDLAALLGVGVEHVVRLVRA